MSAPVSSQALLEAAKYRRTYYSLGNTSPIPDSKIVQIVQDAVKHAPSSFNSQSGRAVVLFGEEQTKAWDIAAKHFLPTLNGVPEVKKIMEDKIASYKAAYGAVIILEDQAVIESWQAKQPSMKNSFPVWSENSTGMLQWIIWTALELEGLRGNLQHHASYNPAIDPEFAKTFGYPESWRATAILNFGAPTGEPYEKTFQPIDDRVFVRGASS